MLSKLLVMLNTRQRLSLCFEIIYNLKFNFYALLSKKIQTINKSQLIIHMILKLIITKI